MCFRKFSEKSSKLTHDLATDKLKTYPKIVKKKSAKSQQKSLHIQKLQQQVCKIKKSKSAKIKKSKSA